jgi:putative ABC transport system permease protein
MNIIQLTPVHLGLSSLLVFLLAFLSYRNRLAVEKPLLIAALRTAIQLSLVGLVMLVWMLMLAAAGREVMARQKIAAKGAGRFLIGTSSMLVSSFSIMVIILAFVIKVEPWYKPQYAIPILGMLLGNTMNGVALAMNTFSRQVWERRALIEQKLALGMSANEAIEEIWQESIKTGMIPIINAMAAAGLVSLPGMMTGQILAGSDVAEAVKYQILIMFMISSGTGFGVMLSLWFMRRRMFDERDRLVIKQSFQIKG